MNTVMILRVIDSTFMLEVFEFLLKNLFFASARRINQLEGC